MAKSLPVKWTHEHRLMALSIYPRMQFGRLHAKNPQIIRVAEMMGRSPGSLALKLVNFAALDPVLSQKGMSNVAKADRALWADFLKHPGELLVEGAALLHSIFGLKEDEELDFLDRKTVRVVASEQTPEDEKPDGRTDEETKKLKRGYAFFRQAILSIYDVQCCITGIAVPRPLVANHIRPARKFPHERFNLSNGLCLSGLHSPAFMGGLITLDEKRRLVLSRRLKKEFSKDVLKANFEPYEGIPIRLPNVLAEPSPEALAYHREVVFKS